MNSASFGADNEAILVSFGADHSETAIIVANPGADHLEIAMPLASFEADLIAWQSQ